MKADYRGYLWIAGGFLFCPCHLPLTLSALGLMLAGTAAGALLRDHVVAAAACTSVPWIILTWRGVRLLRSAPGCGVRRSVHKPY